MLSPCDMTFEELLARAGDATLQQLTGQPALRLLRLLDPSMLQPARLRELITGINSPASILRDPTLRAALTDSLPKDQAAALAEHLGAGNGRDPYGSIRSTRMTRSSAAEHKLFAFFGVAEDDSGSLSPEPVIQIAPRYALFDYQRRAMREVLQRLAEEPRRALLHMPTGAGKTRTAMNIIAQHLRAREPQLAVWLAYSEELCEQAVEEFYSAWLSVGDRPVHAYRFWGGHRPDIGDVRDGLIVAGLNKMYNATRTDLGFAASLGDRASLIVIDEAHQAIAQTYESVLETLFFRKPTTALLGLTATPGRTYDDIGSDRELADFFQHEKVTLQVEGYTNPVKYLVDQGYIARTRFEPLQSHAGEDLSQKDFRELVEKLDVPEHILNTLADNEKRNLLIVIRTEELLKRHRRVLLFASTVQHARLLATVLRARNHNADAITAQTDSMSRARIITRFKSNDAEPMVLCNYGVLTTGFDAPQTSAAIIARPTKSLVLFTQMVGRACRGPKAGGNAEAEIVTVVDFDLPSFRSPEEAFMNWEDVWQ